MLLDVLSIGAGSCTARRHLFFWWISSFQARRQGLRLITCESRLVATGCKSEMCDAMALDPTAYKLVKQQQHPIATQTALGGLLLPGLSLQERMIPLCFVLFGVCVCTLRCKRPAVQRFDFLPSPRSRSSRQFSSSTRRPAAVTGAIAAACRPGDLGLLAQGSI